MAALAETRDIGSHLPLPAGVRRLCCIGDSITYGQGVAPRQTLAMYTARFANIVYPEQLVWVDNRGQSSGNIWHSWIPFTRLLETIQFDAVVFSVCENDAQILESNTVRYSRDYTKSWLSDGKLHPVAKKTLAQLAALSAEQKLRLVVDFFTFTETSLPVVKAIAAECELLGLPFVDLLTYLTKESGMSVAEYIASPFDGHPSDAGQRAAARRIVEKLREIWTPAPVGSSPLSERLVEACDQAIRDGWPPDDVLHWGLMVIEAKEVVARRQRTKPAVAFGDLAAARDAIEERYSQWYARRIVSARSHALHERRDDLWRILEGAYSSIRNLDEMSFIVEHFRDNSAAAELWGLIKDAGYYTENQRLRELTVDLKARLQAMAEEARSGLPCSGPPVFQEFSLLSQALIKNLQKLAALLPDRFLTSEVDPYLILLWQVAQYLVNTSWQYLDEFRRKVQDVASPPSQRPAFFTNIDVSIERDVRRPKRGGVYNMTIEVDYIEPLRNRRRYKLWAGADEDTYIYRYEMPLLVMGDVGIGVPDWDNVHQRFLDGELRIAKVEVSNFSPETDTTKARFVWEPSLTAEPSHWLKLERLLVPD